MSEHDAYDGEVLDLVVPAALEGIRVDRALSLLTGLSRSQALALVTSGAVRLDGTPVTKASLALMAGQHFVALVGPVASDAVSADATVPVDVVLEDPDFVVVNKAPGQVVHPGAGHRDATLVAGLLARYPELETLRDEGLCAPSRPGIVHRLDKGTSGLLVVARTPEAFVSLSGQLADHDVERVYLGLVEGHVAENHGVVEAPIGRSARVPTLMAVRADGRPARTRYDVLARLDSPSVTLLRLTLDTGRTHQIRVHLSTIGHPVVNDARYGHRRDPRLDEDRFFLHATTLAFRHPRTNELVRADAPLPSDLAALVPEIANSL